MHAAFSGDELRLQEVHRFQNHPTFLFNRMHWNIYSLWDEVKLGIAETARTFGDIRALAIDSWAVDYGLVDRRGHLLDLPRHYRDPRNVTAMNDVIQKIGTANLFQRTGLQLLPINTLFQLYALAQDNPELLSTANSMLLIPDLLNYFLTGQIRAEFTNATTTQMCDPRSGDWDTELLMTLGLPRDLCPAIVQPATVLGPLSDTELLRHPGLALTAVVHTASHDTASAVMSIPAASGQYAYISSGTWSLLGTVVPSPVLTEEAQSFNFTNEGGLQNFRLLKNVMGLWLVQETQRALAARGEAADIECLVLQAEVAPQFGFLFDPDDPRLLQPSDMPAALREICRDTGQSPPADTGTLVRGILESLALKYRAVLEELETITGITYDVIHIVGGGSQNRLLNQFTADATNRRVVAGPLEASSMGNVLVQLLAIGELKSSSEIRDLVLRSARTVPFTPRARECWDTAYGRFRAIAAKQQSIVQMNLPDEFAR